MKYSHNFAREIFAKLDSRDADGVLRRDKPAIVDRNGARETTFGELYRLSLSVAAHAVGIGLKGMVPLCMERGLEAAASILGLSMAGFGVAPMSAGTPLLRQEYISAECGNPVWTAEDYLKAQQDAASSERFKDGDILSRPCEHIAYMIYTSGSTGTPKGVKLSQRAIFSNMLMLEGEDFLRLEPGDRVIQSSSLGFIAIVINLFTPLYTGNTVYFLPEEAVGDARLIREFVSEHGITTAFFPPRLLQRIGACPSFKTVTTGSEAVRNLYFPGFRLLCVWGMSEMASLASAYLITEPMANTPIGKLGGDFVGYILDENGKECSEGELCISGPVADGYTGNPELTARVFVTNPFPHDAEHEILFHTGDIVRLLPDGNMEYLDRKDNMIKLNGQRIEPGEIESVLSGCPGVLEAAVKAIPGANDNILIGAWYVPSVGFSADSAAIADYLSQRLPHYMLPTYYTALEEMPRNSNGKIDRKALPLPDADSYMAGAESRSERAEVSAEELTLCSGFEEVLGLHNVCASDDFLLLGGDSIIAMDLAERCGLPGLSPSVILKFRTPASIAAELKRLSLPAPADKPCAPVIAENKKLPDCVPLNIAQKGIYYQCMQYPNSTMYNIPLILRLPRPASLTLEDAKASVDRALAVHPALFSKIALEGEDPVMLRCVFPAEGICKTGELSAEEYKKSFVKPFELSASPLCRAAVLFEGDELLVYLDTHHIISDGTSVRIILKDICSCLAGGEALPEQTDAFTANIESEAGLPTEEDMEYFAGLLAGVEIDSSLLPDFSVENSVGAGCDGGEAPESAMLSFDISFGEERLERLLGGSGVTMSSYFMALYSYAVSIMSGNPGKALICAVEKGRHGDKLGQTVSMFVRTLPVLAGYSQDDKALSFALALQNQLYDSMAHDSVPVGDLCREFGFSPDVMFVYLGGLIDGLDTDIGRASISSLSTDNGFAKLSMSVRRLAADGSHIADIQYRKDLYSAETIEAFAELMQRLALPFAENAVLSDIRLISDKDRTILDSLNDNATEYDRACTMPQRIYELAQSAPDRTAVVFKDARYSYRELSDKAMALADYIRGLGIGKGDTVSIIIPRCQWMAIAPMGVMYTGAVYQPLDPTYPPERLCFMVKDASAKLLIADRALRAIVSDYDGPVLYTDEIDALPASSTEAPVFPLPEDPFVLLYTSGTTGTPKGCYLNHGNLLALLNGHVRNLEMDENSRATIYASFGFDAHLVDTYPALSTGGSVYIIPEEMRLDLPALKEYVDSNSITHMCMTTQVARQFAVECPNMKTLKYLFCGGEKLTAFEPKYNYRMCNCYGPTEGTVYASSFKYDTYSQDIPIGKAISGMRLYVVDPAGRRLPIGAPGELLLCGAQVAPGYLNRPEQTAKAFVANTFEESYPKDYARCYRTGDIVRFTRDGNLMFIGRRDSQVKVRGFRIELSEVEKIIRDFPGIKDATVIARDSAAGKVLNAYVVSDERVDIKALNEFILANKPPYMVPAGTMQLEAIPLTPNLKVDKRKLPEIKSSSLESTETETSRELNVLEKRLQALAAEITGSEGLGLNTNLSMAGLTSISSIRLSVQLYKRFGVNISTAELLKGATILSLENRILEQLLENNGKEQPTVRSAVENSNEVKAEAVSSALSCEAENSSYPLTQSQLGVYLDSQLSGGEAYRMPMLLKLPESTDIEALKKAIVKVTALHPSMLCHIYPDSSGDPAVWPCPEAEITVDTVELGSEELIEAVTSLYTDFEFTPEALLFRFRILTHSSGSYLFGELHHIIADGESWSVLLSDLEKCYLADETAEAEAFTAMDLSLDEQKKRTSPAYSEAKSWFDSVFRGVAGDYMPVPDVSRDENSEGSCPETVPVMDVTIPLSPDLIQSKCKELEVTENVFFLGAFALALSRFTWHEDALFTTVYNGRSDPRSYNLVSMLVKTLPMFVSCDGELCPKDYLAKIREELMLLQRHDIYSFADASREHGLNAKIMFIFQGGIVPSVTLGGKPAEFVSLPLKSRKAELAIEVFRGSDSYRLHAEYNQELYTEQPICSLLEAVAVCAERLPQVAKLSELSLMTDKAMSSFDSFNDTDCVVPFKPAWQPIEDAAAKYPDNIALVSGERRISYRDYIRLSRELARKLLELGARHGLPVEVIVDRTAENYIARQGILEAGCPFLYMSPEYPDERIRFVTEDADVQAIVTTRPVYERRGELIDSLGLPVIFADELEPAPDVECPCVPMEPQDPAYVIYTSGTTGKPKGVRLSNKGLINLLYPSPACYHATEYINESRVASAVTSFAFDASIVEGFFPLSNGVTLVIASDDDIHNPIAYTKLCLDNGVQSILATPSFYLNTVEYPGFDAVIKQLVCVISGGEVLPPSLVDKLLGVNPKLKIINGYGPTECTVACSDTLVTDSRDIHIGTPLTNTKIYILDKFRHYLPKGALGELVITGDCVGLGYINRPELNAQVYIELDGHRAYRSGDLALIDKSDRIRFHGRLDNQVKLRGLRVELGEIESAICKCNDVKTAVVTVHGGESDRFLAAYFTGTRPILPEEIREQISKTLTDYMVPGIIMQLNEMPLTANGKIDKRALPQPVVEKKTTAYVPPVTETEQQLCTAFAKALGLGRVGLDDDFFALGGTSLTATKVAMFCAGHGLPVVYADIFKNPTVRALAALCCGASSEAEVGADAAQPSEAALPVSSHFPEYAEIDSVLEKNNLKDVDAIASRPLGSVLLTGATGFLGMHVLNYLLTHESCRIYCLLRKGSADSVEQRLSGMYVYYFDKDLSEMLDSRIVCIDGDITSKEDVQRLRDVPFDTLFNCAACVKHFANSDILTKVNVTGVEYLADLCLETGRRLIQVSTVSVAGESVNGSPEPTHKISEQELYFGQTLANDYIVSKFDSERLVLERAAKGLDCKIMRAGNLMPRRSDGEFQINYLTNGFMRRLHGYSALGCMPYAELSSELEFSPIDETAGAMVELAKTDSRFTMFHANNIHKVYMSDVARCMNKAGLPIEAVPNEVFFERLNKALLAPEGPDAAVSGLIAYMSRDTVNKRAMLGYENAFTRDVMNRIGFAWSFTDDPYIVNALLLLIDMGFFEINLQ